MGAGVVDVAVTNTIAELYRLARESAANVFRIFARSRNYLLRYPDYGLLKLKFYVRCNFAICSILNIPGDTARSVFNRRARIWQRFHFCAAC